jgi:hypothetical protein
MAFTPDGKHLITCAFREGLPSALARAIVNKIIAWDLATGTEKWSSHSIGEGMAISPDGKYVVAGGDDGQLQLRNLETGKKVRTLKGHGVDAVHFSSDGQFLATADFGSEEVVFGRYAQGAATDLSILNRRIVGRATTLAFTADGRYLVATAAAQAYIKDARVFLWEMASGKSASAFRTAQDWSDLCLVGDGRLVLVGTGEGRGIKAYDFATDKLVATWKPMGFPTGTIALSPDGQRLAMSHSDGTVLIYKADALTKSPPLAPVKRTAKKLEALWTDLSGADVEAAFRARWALAASPNQAVPLLRERVLPVKAPDAQALAGWIAELGSDKFKVREQAERNLVLAGDPAIAALRKVLQGTPSLEVRLRIENVLGKVEEPPLAALRAIAVLETIGTREAREVVEGLAKGALGARITEAAAAVLKRWP